MKAAIVQNGTVGNIVNLPDDWDGSAGQWQPPDGAEVVDATGSIAGVGWSYDGETFSPPPKEPEPEPTLEEERERMVLTQYQARAALLNAGLLDDVETLMADHVTPREIVLMWHHKERIRRTHSATVQMAGALGWTDEQVDDLFRAGMEIEP